MKKRLVSYALFTTALLSPITALASQFYLGGNLGLGSSNRTLAGNSASLIAGYDMPFSPEFSMALEGEFRNFSKESHWMTGNNLKAKSYGVSLKPTYHFHFEQRDLYLSGIVGMHQYREAWRITNGSDVNNERYRDNHFTWGIETGLKVTPALRFHAGVKFSEPTLRGGRVDYDQFYTGVNFYF